MDKNDGKLVVIRVFLTTPFSSFAIPTKSVQSSEVQKIILLTSLEFSTVPCSLCHVLISGQNQQYTAHFVSSELSLVCMCSFCNQYEMTYSTF